MAVCVTFATQTSAPGVEPQTPISRKKGAIQEMSGSQQSVSQSRICPLWGLCLTTSPPPGLLTDLANVKLASWLRSLWESRPMSIVLRRSPVPSFVQHVYPAQQAT